MKPSSSANHFLLTPKTPANRRNRRPPSRQRPGRSWDRARSSKTKIPGKKNPIRKRKTANYCPTKKPKCPGWSSYKHTQNYWKPKQTYTMFFFDKAPRSSNKIKHHQPPGPPATQPFKGKPPSLGVFQSARHKLSCTTTITGRLTQLPGMTGSRR